MSHFSTFRLTIAADRKVLESNGFLLSIMKFALEKVSGISFHLTWPEPPETDITGIFQLKFKNFNSGSEISSILAF